VLAGWMAGWRGAQINAVLALPAPKELIVQRRHAHKEKEKGRE